MNYKIYKMYFKTGLRIGTGKIESHSVEMPSDIIFSAIINEASQLNSETCDKVVALFKEKSLQISDAFPFIGDEYFLPKPLIKFSNASGDSSEKKLYKKIKHIPLSNFEAYVKGESDPEEILKKSENLGHNQIDTKIQKKLKGDNEIYNLSYYRFNDGNGLYFILSYEEEYEEIFDNILYSLSFSGIGGKKTAGLGKFETIEESLPKKIENKINTEKSTMLLSTSMAKEEELYKIDENANYNLIRRGGFIYTENPAGRGTVTRRKRTMHFFKSGSIFETKFQGDIFRVDDGFVHPVYRYGIPLWLEV